MCFEPDSAPPIPVIAGAAVSHEDLVLRSADGGFCFGGRMSLLAAADGHGLAGAVGFYGKPGERNGQPGPVQRAGEIDAPVLALMAGDDHGIGPDEVAELERALTEAGVEHEVVTHLRGRAAAARLAS